MSPFIFPDVIKDIIYTLNLLLSFRRGSLMFLAYSEGFCLQQSANNVFPNQSERLGLIQSRLHFKTSPQLLQMFRRFVVQPWFAHQKVILAFVFPSRWAFTCSVYWCLHGAVRGAEATDRLVIVPLSLGLHRWYKWSMMIGSTVHCCILSSTFVKFLSLTFSCGFLQVHVGQIQLIQQKDPSTVLQRLTATDRNSVCYTVLFLKFVPAASFCAAAG